MNKYNWWLLSDNLFKRSLAVLWHAMFWYLIVIVPFLVLVWLAALISEK